MGNRVGYIFHDNFKDFSPLLYMHWGGDLAESRLQIFLEKCKTSNEDLEDRPDDTMFYFVLSLQGEIGHNSLRNLSDAELEQIVELGTFRNLYDSGCYLINCNKENFGEVIKCEEETSEIINFESEE